MLSACVVWVGVPSRRPTSVFFFFATKPHEIIHNEKGTECQHLEGTLSVVTLEQQHYFTSVYIFHGTQVNNVKCLWFTSDAVWNPWMTNHIWSGSVWTVHTAKSSTCDTKRQKNKAISHKCRYYITHAKLNTVTISISTNVPLNVSCFFHLISNTALLYRHGTACMQICCFSTAKFASMFCLIKE